MYQKTQFANGVRLVTEEMPSVRSVALGLWVGCGSRYEGEGQGGLSHFLEHLFFKGTQRRSARQIAEEIDGVGGKINAVTSREYTCYYVRVMDEHLDLALDLLADIYFNSLFAPEEIEREKGVVLEEIKMYEDSPEELVFDLFTATLWPQHPLGRPVVGRAEVIKALNREKIVSFKEQHYRPDNLVISAAGRISHGNLAEKVEKYFGHFQPKGEKPKLDPPFPACQVAYREKDLEQVHLCLGSRGYEQGNKKYYTLSLLTGILGGSMSSRLFQKVREEYGLVYSIDAYFSSFQDCGIFGIYTALSPENLPQALALISQELDRVRKEGVDIEEVNRTKEQIKGAISLSLESPSNRMNRLGKSELLLGRVITLEEILEELQRITLDDVLQVASEILRLEDYTLVAVGPPGPEKFLWTREFFG